MFVSFIHVNARTKEKLIKVIIKYLKMLPFLKSDGTVLPYGSFPFLAVVHHVCGTLRRPSLVRMPSLCKLLNFMCLSLCLQCEFISGLPRLILKVFLQGLVQQNILMSTQIVFSSVTKLDFMSNQIKEGYLT